MRGKFIQIKEASELLGVSKLTLRNWDNSGKLRAFRHPINNYRVYKTEEVENLLKTIETGKTSANILRRKSTPLFDKKGQEKPKVYNLKIIHLND